jgi:FAD:protein FMN transferase
MRRSRTACVRRARPLLGTWVTVTIECPDVEAANEAASRAFAAVEKVHGLMSAQEPSSDISRLSVRGHEAPTPVHPWTYDVLRIAREVSVVSGGLFDVTVGGRLEELGLLPQVRRRRRRENVASYADIDLLSDSTVRLKRPCRIDLGGIGKGYAVDQAIEAARLDPDIETVIVNAGGDLRVRGNQPQPVFVRDFFHPDGLWPAGAVSDGAIASSGGSGALRDSHRGPVTPLVRRGDRRLFGELPGVTVTASTCTVADALTKVVLLAAGREANDALKHFGARAWISRRGAGFRAVGSADSDAAPCRSAGLAV